MSHKTFMNVTLPLFSEDTPLQQVLDRVGQMSSPAAVSTDGQHYRLLYSDDIVQAFDQHSATTIGGMGAAGINSIELTSPAMQDVLLGINEVMGRPIGQRIGIATVTSDFDGNRFIVAFGEASDLWQRVVSKVYECPKDFEEFSSPGTCPTHLVALRPKK